MTGPTRLIPAAVSAPAASGGRWPAAFHSRFFLAFLLGLVWIGPAWWNLRFIYAMLAWDGMMLVAWLLDLKGLPRPSQLRVSRRWSEAASLGVETRAELEVVNNANGSIEVILEDDVPPALRAELPSLTMTVPGRQKAVGAYTIHPTQRGDKRLGRVFLRYHGPVRLAERWAIADLSQTVRVYPNLRESERYTLYLVRSRQIEQEKRLKRQIGRGREFESLREFRESEELRDICWTATARRGKLITKVYQVERSQSVFVVVDAGRLMLARTQPTVEPGSSRAASTATARNAQAREPAPTTLTKLDYAVNAALSLAHVALYSGDGTGLLAYGRKIQARLPAARGAAHLREFLEQLALVSGELVEADHALAADSLLARQRRRSLVVWLTDLAATAATPEVIEAASRLLPRHLVLFAVVGEPELRLLLARKPESPAEMYQYVAAQEVIRRRELLLRRLRVQGALAMEFSPGRLSTGLVNQYLQIKERSLL
jgi:uncharacterized protein (DUF58 family)